MKTEESPEINSEHSQLIYSKGARIYNREKTIYSINDVGES